MQKVWPYFLVLALAGNLVLAGGPQADEAYACSCAGTRDVEETFERSAAVFSGEVVKAEEELPDESGRFLGPVTFEVEETWKGASKDSVVVYGQGPAVSCGIDFERGETYLVYAYQTGGHLGTDYCGRTKPLSFAGSDVSELNDARGSLPDTGGPGAAPLQATIVAAAALLAAAAFVAGRPRRD